MLNRSERLRKEILLALKSVPASISSRKNKRKRMSKCMKEKRRCIKRKQKRRFVPFLQHRCRRPIPVPIPCHNFVRTCNHRPCPPVPPNPPFKFVVEKDCCGSIVLQGIQSSFTIWQIDVDSKLTVAQVSFYLNSNSTEALEVLIKGDERRRLYVPPGSTTNYIGQGITSVKIPTQGNESTYIEGKYVISTTLQLQTNSALVDEH